MRTSSILIYYVVWQHVLSSVSLINCQILSFAYCTKQGNSALLCKLLTLQCKTSDWLFAVQCAKKGCEKGSKSRLRTSLTINVCVSEAQSDSQTTAVEYREEHMETNSRETLQADFDTFDISEELGFVLEEPLVSFIVIFLFFIQHTFPVQIVFFSIKTDLKQGYKMS